MLAQKALLTPGPRHNFLTIPPSSVHLPSNKTPVELNPQIQEQQPGVGRHSCGLLPSLQSFVLQAWEVPDISQARTFSLTLIDWFK